MEPIMMNNSVNFYLFTMICNIFLQKEKKEKQVFNEPT